VLSNKNRVNPDYYRQAGRDPQAETLNQERQKQLLARERESRPRSASANFIPGGDRTAARSPAAPERSRPGQAGAVQGGRRRAPGARKTTRPATTARRKRTTRRTTKRREG
jgi:hypothetical protein